MNTFKNLLSLLALATVLLAFSSCNNDDDNGDNNNNTQSYFAVANRGSNTITYHNTNDLSALGTTSLPDGTQPTYVAYSSEKDKIYTGGLENGMLYEINAETYQVERSISVGLGAFHLWLNDTKDQLWVNNINSTVKTTTVVDLNSFTVIETINLPTTLGLSTDAVQHDVVIAPSGGHAYVTILDGPDTSYVVHYNTTTFSIVSTAQIGGDAHVGFFGDRLYALSQNAGEIKEFSFINLGLELDSFLFNGVHGITASNTNLFVADLPNGRLGVIDNQNNIISTIDTNLSTTHNLVVNDEGTKLFVSYSGGSQTKVQLYDIDNSTLTLNTTADSGTNPFGVTFIKR